MKSTLIKRKTRRMDLILIAVMTLLLLSAILLSYRMGISRDAYLMTDAALGMTMLEFDLILLFCIVFGSYRDESSARTFILMLMATFLCTLCSVYFYALYGIAEYSTLLHILYDLSYVFGALYWAFLWLYMRGMESQAKKQNALDYAVFIGIAAYMLAIVLDVFFGFFMRMEEGEIILTPYWDIGSVFWTVLYLMFFVRIFCSAISKKEKWQLVSYIILPSVILSAFVLFQLFGHTRLLESITFLGAVISMYLIFFNQYHERGRKLLLKEMELTQTRLNTMVLQTNPHFVYNTLGSIEYFCDHDPAQAKRMLNDFTRYLRSNSANLTNQPMIPFTQELNNLKAYLRIEQVRFPNLKVEYDITAENFMLPCLSVQPLVENAIKHGIGKRRGNAGTVTVRTEELPDSFRITVTDDGVGYTGIPDDGKPHLGITNIRERLKLCCGGTLTVEGTPWQGTTAEIRIPKKGERL